MTTLIGIRTVILTKGQGHLGLELVREGFPEEVILT